VRFRPQTTTSERQLALALAATGRIVSLDEISGWRKDGLLPPMASTGLGAGKGKHYHWREPDILARAQIVCDAARRHEPADQTLVTLFVSGFAVPLPRLRRAWLHRARLRKPPAVRIVREKLDVGVVMDAVADSLLLQAALNVSAAVQIEEAPGHFAAINLLHRALSKLGLAPHGANDSRLETQLYHLLNIIGSMLDTSGLIREATDDELCQAQRHLGIAMAFLRGCGDPSEPVIEILGPQLFLFLLTLLRSGQTRMLDRIMGYLEGTGRQAIAPPAPGLALPA
jgi:hypothetical protein